MKWACRICWLSGEGDEETATGAHLKAMLSAEKRRPGDFPGVKFEKFPASMHAPEFIFGDSAPTKRKRFQVQAEGLFDA